MYSFKENVGFALEGIRYFFRNEKNGKIQGVIACLIVLLSFFFGISPIEWCIILTSIALVIALEMVNTAMEKVCAMLTTEYHPIIKIIKDVAAGAVLWASVFTAIIGCIIFIPYIIVRFL